MSSSDSQDRTEEPTARRLQKARDEGQVPRSTELPGAAVVVSTLLALTLAGGWLVHKLSAQFAAGFVFDRKTLDKPLLLPAALAEQAGHAFLLVLPVMGVTLVMAIIASVMSGGLLFATKAVAPNPSKLNPMQGLKRMFGPHAAIELLKALLKVTIVGGALWMSVALRMDDILRIGAMALEPALGLAGKVILESTLSVAFGLVVIAALDVPWQRHSFMKRMRMTRQEIKDEMKDVEGRPEVKAQIRRRQREMANARMLQRVKDADVVITNPEHFAVALEYDPTGDGAPVLVAKGADFMAAQIRAEAGTHGIHLFPAPELARALYFTTEPEHPIPEALYHAVAQVIAYVYSLEGAQPGRQAMARPLPVVPRSMRFDAEGHRLDEAAAAPA
ncbi:flagellar biosynthesis protein FlhB [Ramlibacter sp. MAHUQ-53]|uniref:flagellar biosynthesis protein FlhB n=1 Tax=unclassified Ramlibacter TaxID=2617605 RepID=UPI003643A22F